MPDLSIFKGDFSICTRDFQRMILDDVIRFRRMLDYLYGITTVRSVRGPRIRLIYVGFFSDGSDGSIVSSDGSIVRRPPF